MPLEQDTTSQPCCEVRVAKGAPRCLLCGGELVPLRTAWRCTRCGQSLCAGCEPVVLGDTAECAD